MFIVFATGGAVAVLVVLLVAFTLTTTESRMSGKESLRSISSYTWQNDELVAKNTSFFDRVISPVLEKSTSLGRRFTPVGYMESKRKTLLHAGLRGPDELDRFMAKRVLFVFAIPVMLAVMAWLPIETKLKLAMMFLGALILLVLPDVRLSSQVAIRQKAIRRTLPDILDLLTISVEAGLGFEQAIDRITDAVPGALSDEFNRMIGEMRAGSARSEALQALETRTGVEEVKSFVLSMVQADTFGVSVGRVLRAQADEMRVKRRQLAQEAAQKAPVKMLLPMTFFIFPPLFIVVMGPAMINIVNAFKH
jgi:tight adherence protein C